MSLLSGLLAGKIGHEYSRGAPTAAARAAASAARGDPGAKASASMVPAPIASQHRQAEARDNLIAHTLGDGADVTDDLDDRRRRARNRRQRPLVASVFQLGSWDPSTDGRTSAIREAPQCQQ